MAAAGEGDRRRAIDSNAVDHVRVTDTKRPRWFAAVNPIMILPSRAGGGIVPANFMGRRP